MRLKKVEIIGFKSFADKTVLEFEEGITAIVGPNGCGKSNVADAFRWVLGEQSAKSLRGNKMPDVIFAGTSHRKPINLAEVTLTFTDIGKELPIDYGEVSVTRRLYRSGESQYLINRHPVRLKDVHDLFLDSGIGKDTFSIFEQGKIDQVIHYTPLERRYIFEEAAGIVRFLQRKKETLRKLEHLDLNLARIRDIHQEVHQQIVILEQQAAKARVYKEQRDLLMLLEKGAFVKKWKLFQSRYTDASKKAEEKQCDCTCATKALENSQQEIQTMRDGLQSCEDALRLKSEELYKVRNDKEIFLRERKNYQEHLKEALHKESRWKREWEELVEKQQHRQGERDSLKKQQQRLETTLLEEKESLKTLRDQMGELEARVSKLRSQQQTCQQERFKLLQEENKLENELKQLQMRSDTQQERVETIQRRQAQLNSSVQELLSALENKKLEMEKASSAVDHHKQRWTILDEEISALHRDLAKCKKCLSDAQQEFTESKARQKVLLRLREDMEGFSAGTKQLLREASNPKSPLFQVLKGLYEYITPHRGAEAALATALRPYAQTLVVQTSQHFQAVLAYAKSQKLKDFSLLCLEAIESLSSITSSPKLPSLLEKVTDGLLARHFLQKVYLAEEEATAQQWNTLYPDTSVWAETGIYFDANRVLFCLSQGENNAFMREAELKALDQRLLSQEAQCHQWEKEIASFQHKIHERQTEQTTLDKTVRREEMKLIEINFGLQKLQGDIVKGNAESTQLEKEQQAISQGILRLQEQIVELSQRHHVAKRGGQQMQQQCLAIEIELEQQTTAAKQDFKVLQEKEDSYQKLSNEHKKVAHAQHILDIKDKENKQQEMRLLEEIELSTALRSQLAQKNAQAEACLEIADQQVSKATEASHALQKDLIDKRNAFAELEKRVQLQRNSLQYKQEENQRLNIQVAQLESQCQSLLSELKERLQLSVEEAQESVKGTSVEEKSLDQIERQVRSVRQELEKAGNINMTSIEECEKNQERYQFLNQQLFDLDKTKEELVQIISQLDAESRKMFKETFHKISANFQKNFQILFNGGEAELQFTEDGDILERGIDIIAKPPGKQMRSINLMSGGEKCLTAMALLFAIFEVKPAPFCILDEIDAPLDDSNVERFVNMVKHFAEQCQFIIVTHNKRTMAMAHVLFGISMEEKGVSKVLSMEFKKEPVLV